MKSTFLLLSEDVSTLEPYFILNFSKVKINYYERGP